jgi:hypothetical protein
MDDLPSATRTYVILVTGLKPKIVVFPLPEEYPNTFNDAIKYFQTVLDPAAIVDVCMSFELYSTLKQRQ